MHEATKAERRAARERVSRYYESELAKLIDRVDEAIARYRDGEIGLHHVDEVIHRYSKAARALWKFCWSTGSGSQVVLVARTLERRGEHLLCWLPKDPLCGYSTAGEPSLPSRVLTTASALASLCG